MKNGKKRWLFILIVTVILYAGTLEVFGSSYIPITTASEFYAIRRNLNGNFKLKADIDLSAYSMGAGWQPINNFTGTLNGNGYVIRGLQINRPTASNIGLFGSINNASIHNLTVELGGNIFGLSRTGVIAGSSAHRTSGGSVLENNKVVGNGFTVRSTALLGYVGGIIGYSGDNTTLADNTVYNVNILTTGVNNYAGGIVGAARNSQLRSNIVNNTNIEAFSYAGGIAGVVYGLSNSTTTRGTRVYNAYVSEGSTVLARGPYGGGAFGAVYERAEVTNVITHANVRGFSNYNGGFAGVIYNNAIVRQSAAYGDVHANRYTGGFVGAVYNNSIVINSYSRGNVRGTTEVGGFVGTFYNFARIENTFTTSAVTGNGTRTGSFAGEHIGVNQRYAGTNFFNTDKSDIARPHGTGGIGAGSGGAINNDARPRGISTQEMMTQLSFTGWDFENIWHIGEGTSFPYFAPFFYGRYENSSSEGIVFNLYTHIPSGNTRNRINITFSASTSEGAYITYIGYSINGRDARQIYTSEMPPELRALFPMGENVLHLWPGENNIVFIIEDSLGGRLVYEVGNVPNNTSSSLSLPASPGRIINTTMFGEILNNQITVLVEPGTMFQEVEEIIILFGWRIIRFDGRTSYSFEIPQSSFEEIMQLGEMLLTDFPDIFNHFIPSILTSAPLTDFNIIESFNPEAEIGLSNNILVNLIPSIRGRNPWWNLSNWRINSIINDSIIYTHDDYLVQTQAETIKSIFYDFNQAFSGSYEYLLETGVAPIPRLRPIEGSSWWDSNEWGVSRIRADHTWYIYGSRLSQIQLGIADTPFAYWHEDLNFPTSVAQNNINNIYGAYFANLFMSGALGATDVDEIEEFLERRFNHGTHVMGTAAAMHNNGLGISGVMPISRLNLHGFDVFNVVQRNDNGTLGVRSNFEAQLDALDFLVESGIRIINFSLGGTIPSHNKEWFRPHFENRVYNLLSEGHDFIVIHAAGNDAYNARYNSSFANISDTTLAPDGTLLRDRIITVGASDRNNQMANFTNYGPRIDVVAPGVGIFSTLRVPQGANQTGSGNAIYGSLQGTSMAAPHVAGIAGMVWAANPNLTGPEVRDIILRGSTRPSQRIYEHRIDVTYPDMSYYLVDALSSVHIALYGNTSRLRGYTTPGAEIIFENVLPIDGMRAEIFADEQGFFDINQIPLGSYNITIKAYGFEIFEARLDLRNPQVLILDFELERLPLYFPDYIINFVSLIATRYIAYNILITARNFYENGTQNIEGITENDIYLFIRTSLDYSYTIDRYDMELSINSFLNSISSSQLALIKNLYNIALANNNAISITFEELVYLDILDLSYNLSHLIRIDTRFVPVWNEGRIREFFDNIGHLWLIFSNELLIDEIIQIIRDNNLEYLTRLDLQWADPDVPNLVVTLPNGNRVQFFQPTPVPIAPLVFSQQRINNSLLDLISGPDLAETYFPGLSLDLTLHSLWNRTPPWHTDNLPPLPEELKLSYNMRMPLLWDHPMYTSLTGGIPLQQLPEFYNWFSNIYFYPMGFSEDMWWGDSLRGTFRINLDGATSPPLASRFHNRFRFITRPGVTTRIPLNRQTDIIINDVNERFTSFFNDEIFNTELPYRIGYPIYSLGFEEIYMN